MLTSNQDYAALLRELQPAAEGRLRKRHKLNREDRDDVLQESLVYLVKAMERGRVNEPAALLNTILDVRAKARVLANKERLAVEAPSDLTETLHKTAADFANFAYIDSAGTFFPDDFNDAVRGLDEHERDAFILTELRGVTEYEAGQLLNAPPSTVRGRAERARKTLRKELL